MRFMKPLLFIIGLTLVLVTVSTVTAQYDEWTYDDSASAWTFWGLTGALCFLPVIGFIISIVIAIWVYKDAERRGSSGALWLIILLLTNILGLIIWLIVRPPIGGKQPQTSTAAAPPPASTERRCPSCGRVIPDDARVCPYCGKNFEA